MKNIQKNEHGIAHLGLLLAGLVVIGIVGFAGIRVFSSNTSTSGTYVLGKNTTKDNKPKMTGKKTQPASSGSVQIVVKEQVKNSKGKTTTVARGNVPIELQASSDKLRCRDAGKIYIKKGNVVFSGKTDADKDHKKNLGKIKADACKVGEYSAVVKVSDKYDVVGASTKKVTVKKKKGSVVTFTIKKKGQPTAKPSQDASPVPATPPEPQQTAPITPAQEKVAIDKTAQFENDVFFSIFKSCPSGETDAGLNPDSRRDNFKKNASSYLTPTLIAKVNNELQGDPFPLFGVTDVKCGQYKQIDRGESKPLVSTSSGTTAVVEHTFRAIPRDPPTQGYAKATEFQKIWVYNLVRDGDTWKIDSISLK